MSLALADDYTQLALHVLAHVPRQGPGNLLDARHLERSRQTFSPATHTRLLDDAELLAALGDSSGLDLLPELHGSLAAFRRTAARSLAEVTPHEVADATVLWALQQLGPAAELAHAAMALLAEEFTAVYTRVIEPWARTTIAAIDPWLAAIAACTPGLADARVELVWALGPHGRAMPGRLLTGCADPHDPVTPAILAMHEYAVCTSNYVDYIPGEWDALIRGARWCAAAPPPLREAHARWLASLELAPLLRGAVETGLLTASDAIHLERSPDRAERLRTL